MWILSSNLLMKLQRTLKFSDSTHFKQPETFPSDK